MERLGLLADRLWTPWLLGLFLLTGLYYSVRTGFFQLFGVRRWLGDTLGSLGRRKGSRERGISRFQALATALGSTIGTGSVAGVATAVCFGGPGAVFWMWVSAVLGMMTGCAEKILAVSYRCRGEDGWQGGPMYYLANGLHSRFLAGWFALACVGGALCGGCLVQSNSMAQALHSTLGWDKLAVGAGTAVLVFLGLRGGLARIARVSEYLVPVMGVLFLGAGAAVLWVRRAYVPGALSAILTEAFRPQAAAGGWCMSTALRYGVARGVFTNEAGMGSSALAHASSSVEHPGEQGMWGILEVFVATLLICTMTALVILTCGVFDPVDPAALAGVPLTAASFSVVLGGAGEWVVNVCLLLFAFSSLLGWSYYGRAAVEWLAGRWAARWLWPAAFLAVTVLGSITPTGEAWQLVDLFTALMALPNLAALLVLSPGVLRNLNDYLAQKDSGAHP